MLPHGAARQRLSHPPRCLSSAPPRPTGSYADKKGKKTLPRVSRRHGAGEQGRRQGVLAGAALPGKGGLPPSALRAGPRIPSRAAELRARRGRDRRRRLTGARGRRRGRDRRPRTIGAPEASPTCSRNTRRHGGGRQRQIRSPRGARRRRRRRSGPPLGIGESKHWVKFARAAFRAMCHRGACRGGVRWGPAREQGGARDGRPCRGLNPGGAQAEQARRAATPPSRVRFRRDLLPARATPPGLGLLAARHAGGQGGAAGLAVRAGSIGAVPSVPVPVPVSMPPVPGGVEGRRRGGVEGLLGIGASAPPRALSRRVRRVRAQVPSQRSGALAGIAPCARLVRGRRRRRSSRVLEVPPGAARSGRADKLEVGADDGGDTGAGRSDRRIDRQRNRLIVRTSCPLYLSMRRVACRHQFLLIVPGVVARRAPLSDGVFFSVAFRYASSSLGQSSSGAAPLASAYPASRPFVSRPRAPVLVPLLPPRDGVAPLRFPSALRRACGHVLELPLRRLRGSAPPPILTLRPFPSRRLDDLLERPLGSLDHLPLFLHPLRALTHPLREHGTAPRRRTPRTERPVRHGDRSPSRLVGVPDPVEVPSLLPPRAPQVPVLELLRVDPHGDVPVARGGGCTDARGLPFALSAGGGGGGFADALQAPPSSVRLCAVQLVPTTLAMSTWFLAWKPPAARVPLPPHARHSTTPTPPHATHVSTVLRPGRRHALLRFVRRVDEARTTSGSILRERRRRGSRRGR